MPSSLSARRFGGWAGKNSTPDPSAFVVVDGASLDQALVVCVAATKNALITDVHSRMYKVPHSWTHHDLSCRPFKPSDSVEYWIAEHSRSSRDEGVDRNTVIPDGVRYTLAHFRQQPGSGGSPVMKTCMFARSRASHHLCCWDTGFPRVS